VIEAHEATDKSEGFNLCVLAILLSLVSLPAMVYHKDVIAEYAPKLIEVSKRRLLTAPAKALRDVRREHIEAIVKAVDNLSKRVIDKAEREKEIGILKLEVALLCLNSSYMERRIQGIRDLNNIIKNTRISSTGFAGRFLVEWMQTHGVFDVLFDAKKTHLQLVQRCDEILKLLLQEDMLSEPLLEQFWGLTHTDLRLEVYKIVSDCSFHFK
jgi:ubiquitin carboxyl-terminal hydrolase 34